MREFEFELRLCAHLERAGRPAADERPGPRGSASPVVARQLGAGVGSAAGRRVMDVVLVEPGPALAERAAITPDTIPPAALEGSASIAEWRPVTDVIDRPPARAHEVADAAVDAGFF
ncbi:MAG: DUF5787 family protein, partial [Halobacteriaceae archaeon]